METVIKQISVSTVYSYTFLTCIMASNQVKPKFRILLVGDSRLRGSHHRLTALLNAMHMDDIEVSALFYPGADIRGTVGKCLSDICHRYDLIYLSTGVNNLSVLKGKSHVQTA